MYIRLNKAYAHEIDLDLLDNLLPTQNRGIAVTEDYSQIFFSLSNEFFLQR